MLGLQVLKKEGAEEPAMPRIQPFTPEQQNLMPSQAEAIYGISQWILRRRAYSGEIRSIKVGTRLLIPRSECERLLNEGMRERRMVPRADREPKQLTG